jgi:LacI family transcriptional regulator
MSKSGNNGNGTVGIKQIAKRANVAIATVDRVIHNRGGVSEKTKEKINAIIKELNYQPNLLARRLASQRIYTFAILIPKVSIETAFWEAPLKGIERAETEIAQYGINIQKYFFDLNDKASFSKQVDLILDNDIDIDGLLLAPSFIDESIEVAEACKERKIPYVFIDSDVPNQDNLCYFGPHLTQSGYLAAHLMKYSVTGNDKILVVDISKEIDNQNHFMRIEDGFRDYFNNNGKKPEIIKSKIKQTDYPSIELILSNIFYNHQDIKAIFAINSRVSSVARYLEQENLNDIFLIGFDFLKENVDFLKRGTIDFLICQQPEEQGYKGIMALYQKMILNLSVDKVNYMPIDIITQENYEFYHN